MDDSTTATLNNRTESFANKTYDKREGSLLNPKPKHLLEPHDGFEVVETPEGDRVKLAYGKLYALSSDDVEIELAHIRKYETAVESDDAKIKKLGLERLKFHYKQTIKIVAPHIAAGWNRWSEEILNVFTEDKRYKVVWGSGNCGKSVVFACLLYIKWRVNPEGRMVVVASKVTTDAVTRVFGYIKEIHLKAPKSRAFRFHLEDTSRSKALYVMLYDKDSNRWVKSERACIALLPIKVNAAANEAGSNLMGKHPDDRLIIAFDEAQELPGRLLEERIFANWLTNNKRLDVYAWGNPMAIDFHAVHEWDMLFKLGATGLTLEQLKTKEKDAEKTTKWTTNDTAVLHLAMTDSPKDDPDEVNYKVRREDGTELQRLFFLAGKSDALAINEKIPTSSPTWYSQVLGFPFIDLFSSHAQGTLSPAIVQTSREYPLIWADESKLRYFMGVDPSATGLHDAASIAVGRMGLMRDGRMGLDFMNGRHCRTVHKKDDEVFTDTVINVMHELSQQLGIPLENIAVETHGVGEVMRYGLQKHIEDGRWANATRAGFNYHVVNPTAKPSDRPLFKVLNRMEPALDIVYDVATELWLAVRCAFQMRQIFNVPDNILKQFYDRQLTLVGSGRGKKYRLESKENLRKRNIKSPNDADALAFAVELMRLKGFNYKYYKGWRYKELAGPEVDEQKKIQLAASRLEMIGRVLGIHGDLSTGRKQPKSRPVPRTYIDSV